jgi:cytochrome c-type protein NapB
MKNLLSVWLLFPLLWAPVLQATETSDASGPDGVRPGGTLSQEFSAPVIPRELSQGRRAPRNYPEQPPTIPHSIRDYQVDKNFNQCLSCHSRSRSPETGAPMVSITHFLDRDNQPLAAVSPRRYFCLQCHVVQHDVAPVTGNSFISIDGVLSQTQGRAAE